MTDGNGKMKFGMTLRPSAEGANADAFAEAMNELHERALPPPITLSGYQVQTLLDALRDVDDALKAASDSKIRSTRRLALSASGSVSRVKAMFKTRPVGERNGG